MQEQTLGEAIRGLARHKAQLALFVLVAVVGLFLVGTRDQPEPRLPAGTAAASSSEVAQPGSAKVSGALAEPAGALNAVSGGSSDVTPVDSAPAGQGGPVSNRPPGAAPNPAPGGGPAIPGGVSLPDATNPLTLVTDQLPFILATAGPATAVLAAINPFLPPIPVPPAAPLPAIPAELDPVLAAVQPVVGPVCGNLGLTVIVAILAGNFPLPITPGHISSVLGNVFAVCSAVTLPTQ